MGEAVLPGSTSSYLLNLISSDDEDRPDDGSHNQQHPGASSPNSTTTMRFARAVHRDWLKARYPTEVIEPKNLANVQINNLQDLNARVSPRMPSNVELSWIFEVITKGNYYHFFYFFLPPPPPMKYRRMYKMTRISLTFDFRKKAAQRGSLAGRASREFLLERGDER